MFLVEIEVPLFTNIKSHLWVACQALTDHLGRWLSSELICNLHAIYIDSKTTSVV
jgi:hypothetical protein